MHILIAEDDVATAEFLSRSLTALGHEVAVAETGEIALSRAVEPFDVVILDRMLPGMDGLAVLKAARTLGMTTPVLMLTALGQIADRVEGLSTGADDYLVKPFAIDELVARLHAIVRRHGDDEAQTRIDFGGLSLDLLQRELRCGGRLVALQPREFRILTTLVCNAGRVVTRTMLLEAVWGFHFDPQTNLVETHMSRLRTKLAVSGVRETIETVRGAGYRLKLADQP
jgi:two-component system, OmpR family, response regulator